MTDKNVQSLTAATRVSNEMNPLNNLIPNQVVESTLGLHESDQLFQYLLNLIGYEKAFDIFTTFRLGTLPQANGATILWQTDHKQGVHTGWLTLFDYKTGHPYTAPPYVPVLAHIYFRLPDFVARTCLFGEHQLSKRPTATVVIVGSEFAAMIGMAFLPSFVWLASREMPMLNPYQYEVLAGRKVILLPSLSEDGSVYATWSALANQLRQLPNCHVSVSRYLEDKATSEERTAGLGIADFLIRDHSPINDQLTTLVDNSLAELEYVSPVPETNDSSFYISNQTELYQ